MQPAQQEPECFSVSADVHFMPLNFVFSRSIYMHRVGEPWQLSESSPPGLRNPLDIKTYELSRFPVNTLRGLQYVVHE